MSPRNAAGSCDHASDPSLPTGQPALCRRPLFDWYLFADYSGNPEPKKQQEAIAVWFADRTTLPSPIPGLYTRDDLRRLILRVLCCATSMRKRVIWGLDHQWSWPAQLWRLAGVKVLPWRARLDRLCVPVHGASMPRLDLSVRPAAYAQMFNQFCDPRGRSDQGPFYFKEGNYGGIGKGIPDKFRHFGRRYRVTEQFCGEGFPAAEFGRGRVAGQTLCGLPHLRRLLRACQKMSVHTVCWPFDGLSVLERQYHRAHVGIEIYPRLYDATGWPPLAIPVVNEHHMDAWRSCRFVREQDLQGNLARLLDLSKLPAKARRAARYEGWIAGVLSE
jgi:hypothetical protein